MGKDSKIAWCDHTFNPWWGCTYASPGCEHCYAKREATRFGYQSLWGGSIRRFFGESHWKQPLAWNHVAELMPEKKTLVFCGSMCDVFEVNPNIPKLEEERAWLWKLIKDTPALTWLLLTKRPENIMTSKLVAGFDELGYHKILPINAHLGITGENQRMLDKRMDICNEAGIIPWVSMEPMIGPITIKPRHLKYISWVIVGGESGVGARPMETEWARAIRDQCLDAGIPFFFKQWGFHIHSNQVEGALDNQIWHQTPWGDRE